MQLEGPTTAGLMYPDSGGDGPVVVLLHGVLMGGSLWDTVIEGLGDRYRCVVPELPFGAHTAPMPDGADRGRPVTVRYSCPWRISIESRGSHFDITDWDYSSRALISSSGKSDRSLLNSGGWQTCGWLS